MKSADNGDITERVKAVRNKGKEFREMVAKTVPLLTDLLPQLSLPLRSIECVLNTDFQEIASMVLWKGEYVKRFRALRGTEFSTKKQVETLLAPAKKAWVGLIKITVKFEDHRQSAHEEEDMITVAFKSEL